MKIRIKNIVLVSIIICCGVILLPFILVAKVGYEFNRLQYR
jgi:hypothetical protein